MPDCTTSATADPLADMQAELGAIRRQIGGRLALTWSIEETGTCAYLTHWFRPGPTALEDCRAVGSGTLAQCVAAARAYARRFGTEARHSLAA